MSYNMSELENSSYKDKKERVMISKSNAIISDNNAKARAKSNYQKYGNSKGIIDIGIAYRLGIVTKINVSNDAEKKSFLYGLYEGANLQLDMMAKYHLIPERVKNKIIEKMIGDNPETSKEEIESLFSDKSYEQNVINNMLLTVGRRDSKDLNVVFDKLSEALRENEYYLQGYNNAKKEAQKKARKR